MARSPYPHSDRDLIARIARSPGGRAGYKQLVRELGLGGGRERRLLVEQLTRMVARGELRRSDDDQWSIPKSEPSAKFGGQGSIDGRTSAAGELAGGSRSGRDRLVSGRLDLHRDGFGFVRPEGGTGGGDIFIPPNELNGAMQGDVVLVDEAVPGREGRRSGRIARVLTRRNPTVVGLFHYDRPHGRRSDPTAMRGNFVRPLDERIAGMILIADGDEVVLGPAESPHRMLGEEARRQRAGRGPEAGAGGGGSADGTATEDPRWPLEGLAVEVEIVSFPTPGRPARGRVIEVLGAPDAFGVDVEIVIRKHHLPHTFPATVLAEAGERAKETVAELARSNPAALERREDLRGLPIVTIDGETARDFDDAVLVRRLASGHTELQVHIADVSHYVQAASAVDTEARLRGTSVYFPDRAVPMLPHTLSSGMCSLLPDEDRLVLSCVMEIDGSGEVVGYRVGESVIRSVRRMTYTSVQRCLNASPAAAGWNQSARVTAEPSAEDRVERERVALEAPELPAALDAMLELALRLNAKRVRRGSIDFDLPEPVVEFDPEGNMKAIVRSERGWSHRLIEEFMLSANECVSTWLEEQGIASIYRIHEMPDPKRIVEFEETAAQFGHSLGLGNLPVKRFTMKADRRAARQDSGRGGRAGGGSRPRGHEVPEAIAITPQMYQRLVRRISGTAEERILAYLMLRSLKQARYAEQNVGHFALAAPSYTHFTSPIRRYPDLIVHRLVRAMLESGADPRGGPLQSTDPQPWQAELERSQGRQPSRPMPVRPAQRRARESRADPIAAEELNDIAVESSQAERRAADAERELIEWKKMRFMEDKVGSDFGAVILSCTKYGFFVELDELFIEGLVPLSSLVGDHYSFRDKDRSIVGARSGHVFALGQRVQVLLDRIDRQQRRLQFALLPGIEPLAQTGSLRKARPVRERPTGQNRAARRRKRR